MARYKFYIVLYCITLHARGGQTTTHMLHTAQEVYLCSLQLSLHGSINLFVPCKHSEINITYE